MLDAPEKGGGPPQGEFRQGFRWEGDDPAELEEVVEAAFDYRGNVTLLLRGGGEVTGYLFNRDREVADPFLALLPADGSPRARVLYRDIRGIAFSGRDTAEGKSWQAWLKRHEAKKDAAARGENAGPADLFPEPLD